MKRHQLLAIGMLLLAFGRAASAGDVAVYRQGERPDPRAIAAILSGSPVPPGVKMRSIRLLPDPAAAPAPEAARQVENATTAAAPASATPVGEASAPVAAIPVPSAPQAGLAAPRIVASNAPVAMAAQPDSFSLPVPFSFDSARILPESREQLEAVIEGIKLAPPGVHILVEGHTDATGSDAYNMLLSFRRAEAVKEYLVAHGVAPERLHVAGMGRSMPLNAKDPYAADNRRVQFRPLSDADRVAGRSGPRG
jgi:outer membrane protein OmpA-like peptidoglycan-associated protein